MTCRFEDEFKGKPYPRTCPDCGISGKCHKEYSQIKKPEGGYVLVDCNGLDRNKTPIGIDGKPFIPHEGHIASEPIPAGVYFYIDNFYDTKTRHGKGHDFWIKWCARKSEFPTEPQPKLTPAEIGDAAWGRDRAQEAVDAAAQSNVGIKISRVQRAKLMDLVEHMLSNKPPLFDIAIDEYTNRIIAIFNET